jgi:hypothetical protein
VSRHKHKEKTHIFRSPILSPAHCNLLDPIIPAMSIPPPHLRILSLVLLTMIRILAPHLGFAMTWISAPPLGLVQILDFALTILTAHRMIAILLMIFYLYRIQTLILLVGCADVGGADVNVAPTDYFALRV